MKRLRPSGYEGLLLRMMLCRRKWLFLNMAQKALVDGVRRALLLMGSGVGNLSILLWIFSSLSFVLRWEMELGCYFGRTSGAGINHSSLNSQIFLGWHLWETPLCKRFCLGMGVCILGISLLQEARMTGKRKAFLICYLYSQNWIWISCWWR